MADFERISIALPADMATLVRKTVESGDYASSSEVIREALREWKARRAARSEAMSELRRLRGEGIDSGRSAALDGAAQPSEARPGANSGATGDARGRGTTVASGVSSGRP